MRFPAVRFVVLVSLLALSGCSTFLISHGVLDAPEKKAMRVAKTRAEFEAIVGKPIGSRETAAGLRVELYRYVDGEAAVVGLGGRPMSGERTGRAFVTGLTMGIFEPLMVPTAMNERRKATREIYVIYARDDRILAICSLTMPNSGDQGHLCAAEPPPEADSKRDQPDRFAE